jgi:hypothetical protein
MTSSFPSQIEVLVKIKIFMKYSVIVGYSWVHKLQIQLFVFRETHDSHYVILTHVAELIVRVWNRSSEEL